MNVGGGHHQGNQSGDASRVTFHPAILRRPIGLGTGVHPLNNASQYHLGQHGQSGMLVLLFMLNVSSEYSEPVGTNLLGGGRNASR